MTDLLSLIRQYHEIIYSANISEHSRELIPLFTDVAHGHELITMLKTSIDVIPHFQWTAQQFELLNFIDLTPHLDKLISIYTVQFLIYLCKHYQTRMNLLDATPENVTSYLDGQDMVTFYAEDLDVDTLGDVLIPCPYIKHVDGSKYQLMYKLHLQGLSCEEVQFWYTGNDLTVIHQMKLWSLVSTDYINRCAQVGNSYPLLTFKHLLYSSMRPRTGMSMLQTPLSHYYTDISQISNNKVPVTRYATGMSKGKYHGTRPDDICGYFYYLEPESTTYLTYTTHDCKGVSGSDCQGATKSRLQRSEWQRLPRSDQITTAKE